MKIGMNSHVGKVRKLNEDSCANRNENGILLVTVADGMGGHNAGEIASDVAVKSIEDYIFLNDITNTSDALKQAVIFANKSVFEKSDTDAGYIGMGTTTTTVLIFENKVYIANVGDSRTYLLRNNRLKQITKDHSYVQRLVDSGYLTKTEARFHPRSNVITRAIGTNDSVIVDLFTMDIVKGDVYFLCSDGLTNHVDDKDIEDVLNMDLSPDEKITMMIDMALNHGGNDNITAIIVDDLGDKL